MQDIFDLIFAGFREIPVDAIAFGINLCRSAQKYMDLRVFDPYLLFMEEVQLIQINM